VQFILSEKSKRRRVGMPGIGQRVHFVSHEVLWRGTRKLEWRATSNRLVAALVPNAIGDVTMPNLPSKTQLQ